MRYDWLVDLIVVVHFAYLGYVVLGGFLAWRWPRAFWVHLVAGIWGVLIVFAWVDCPLTKAEHWARQRAGETPSDRGFIERYVTGVIYPEKYVTQVQLAVAVVVLLSWLGALILWRRRREFAARRTVRVARGAEFAARRTMRVARGVPRPNSRKCG